MLRCGSRGVLLLFSWVRVLELHFLRRPVDGMLEGEQLGGQVWVVVVIAVEVLCFVVLDVRDDDVLFRGRVVLDAARGLEVLLVEG
jgi:hypothetical protein